MKKLSKPTTVIAGYLCKVCTAWIPFESHGTYCPNRTIEKRSP